MKHTPGPWEWRGHWLHGKQDLILWYTTDDDGVRAKPENARLIAAAPDLLEACQAVVKSAEANQAAINIPLLDALRAAIAKATAE